MIAWRRFLGVAGGTFLAGVFLACGSPSTNPAGGVTMTESDAEASGVVFAREHIDPLLKSPSTADYHASDVVATQKETLADSAGVKRDCWVVRGGLDAMNPFGVPMRHRWLVIVTRRHDARTSECAAVALDGTDVYMQAGFQGLLKEREDQARADREAFAKAQADAEKAERDAKAKADKAAADKKSRDEKPARDEKDAAALLGIAQDLVRAGKPDKALDRLRKIVKDYPDTKAAGEARDLLKKLER